MDKEENPDKHKRNYTPPKAAKKVDHEKTVTELDRRNAHLHAKTEDGKAEKGGAAKK